MSSIAGSHSSFFDFLGVLDVVKLRKSSRQVHGRHSWRHKMGNGEHEQSLQLPIHDG